MIHPVPSALVVTSMVDPPAVPELAESMMAELSTVRYTFLTYGRGSPLESAIWTVTVSVSYGAEESA